MKRTNKKVIGLLSLLILLLMSCNAPRTVYLSNKTKVPIIVMMEEKPSHTSGASFEDSLNGISIMPGHRIINFGAGKWSKADKQRLTDLLQTTWVMKGKNADTTRLPVRFQLRHYGWFVNELVIRIHNKK